MNSIDRRNFLVAAAGGSTASVILNKLAWLQESKPNDHFDRGTNIAVTSTSREATEAALLALAKGGNAADAYMSAAITQTVSEIGLTSIGGAFGIQFFDAKTKKTTGVTGRLGPAKNEAYDFERGSPETQSGRAMPVPGFIGGLYAAHKQYGRMAWEKLFAPAIQHAEEGFLVNPKIIEGAKRRGVRHPEGKKIWAKDGKMLQPKQPLRQPEAAVVLRAVAQGGPDAFYEGEFARHYVQRAQADGGKITLDDLKGWKQLVSKKAVEAVGNYRGHQVIGGDLVVYALHLNEALDLKASGSAATSAESVYKQFRIMEEVFLSTKDHSKKNNGQFIDPDYARRRADFVLESKPRPLTIDAIFNTCFLVVRDKDGNVAWGTHSINTPTAFGAGIVVDGIYAAHAMNRGHVRGGGGSAPGISTSYALLEEGDLRLVVGSPGFGFVHGPYQYGTGIMEWDQPPTSAMNLPRFSLPNQNGVTVFERHYAQSVFDMLDERKIKYSRSRPTTSTGLVGALSIGNDGKLVVVQDGRRFGFARAD